ncbi:MAG TPA: oligosaccharide flippase family protein [Dehalococcoidia bacterium]|nr:oligosaccharide flippase family protein [Dehalococcoidia bacterium]
MQSATLAVPDTRQESQGLPAASTAVAQAREDPRRGPAEITPTDESAPVDAATSQPVSHSGRTIVRNVFALGSAQLVTWLASSVLAVLLPRYLGDGGFGSFSIAFSLTELCGLIASFGTGTFLTREVARDPSAAAALVRTALLTRLPLALAAAALAVAGTVALGYSSQISLLVYVLCANIAISSLSGLLIATLQGIQKMRPIALNAAVSKLALVSFVAVALVGDFGELGVAVAWVLGSLTALLIPSYVLYKSKILSVGGSLVSPRWVLSGSLAFLVWQASFFVYGQIDILLLSQFSREETIGWYGAAYRIINIPLFVPAIITAATFPALSRAVSERPSEYRAIVERSLRAILLVTMPIAGLTIVMADSFVEILYPPEFHHAAPLMRILALHVPLIGVDMVIGTVLITKNRQAAWAIVAIAAAVLNPAFNVFAIPLTERAFDNGAIGAAAITGATELFIFVIGLYLARTSLRREDLWFGARCLASAACMMVVLFFASDVFLPLAVLAGASAYLVASVLLRTVSREEARLVLGFFSRRAEQTRDDESDVNKLGIGENFARFNALADEAEAYLKKGNLDRAAAQAHLAAMFACWHHSGLFVSLKLEGTLRRIARASRRQPLPAARPGVLAERRATPKRVLHVVTHVGPVGGHSRMVWRWITQDGARAHSVAITRQGSQPIPERLAAAVRRSGGRFHVLNQRSGNLLAWSARLQTLAASFDLVVLHTDGDDVIPTLAFSNQDRPPVVFIDHADHIFWLGRSACDLVAHLRDFGSSLGAKRRLIPADRSLVFPIVLGAVQRTMSRTEAKRRLGLPPDAVVLLSVARPHKYQPIDERTFMANVLPALRKSPAAHLVIVGVSEGEQWAEAVAVTGGRVKTCGLQENTGAFYEAADIYVDSFPLGSTTSLLEAGLYGLPLIGRCAGPSICGPLCAGSPGLDGVMLHTKDPDEFTLSLSRLIEDEAERLRVGGQTQERITRFHAGDGWRESLENLYATAISLPKDKLPLPPGEEFQTAEMDVSVYRGFSATHSPTDFDRSVRPLYLRELPSGARLRLWLELLRQKQPVDPKLLLPEWLARRLAQLAQGR